MQTLHKANLITLQAQKNAACCDQGDDCNFVLTKIKREKTSASSNEWFTNPEEKVVDCVVVTY